MLFYQRSEVLTTCHRLSHRESLIHESLRLQSTVCLTYSLFLSELKCKPYETFRPIPKYKVLCYPFITNFGPSHWNPYYVSFLLKCVDRKLSLQTFCLIKNRWLEHFSHEWIENAKERTTLHVYTYNFRTVVFFFKHYFFKLKVVKSTNT